MNNIEYVPITTGIRPAKLAVLLDINSQYWETDCLSSVAMFNRIWGGDYNLIIPTDGDEIHPYFLQILKAYDPDYIQIYSGTVRQLKEFDRKQFDEYLQQFKESSLSSEGQLLDKEKLAEDDYFLNTELTNLEISDRLKSIIKKETNIFRGDSFFELFSFRYENKVSYPLTDMSGILKYSDIKNVKALKYTNSDYTLLTRLLLHSQLGIIDSYLEESLEKENIVVNYEELKTDSSVFKLLDAIYERDRAFNKKSYAFNVSSAHIDYYLKRSDTDNPPIALIIGNELSDFCLYYCLSRINKAVYWFPNEFELVEELSNIVNARRESLKRSRTKLSLLSVSLNEIEMNRIMSWVEERASSAPQLVPYTVKNSISDFTKNNLMVYCTENHTNEQVLIFDEKTNQSIHPIDTPVPLYFSHVLPYGHFWITDILVKDVVFPKNQNLSASFLTAKSYHSSHIRITNNGISYFSPNIVYMDMWGDNIKLLKTNPFLKLPSAFRVFEKLFQVSGYHIKTSDKGKYAQVFLDKFGGIESLKRDVLINGNKKVLDKFIDTSKNLKGIYTNGILLNKRRYLDYSTIKHIVEEDHAASSIINTYLKKGIIERGFIFKCEECRNADWYSILDVGHTFKCFRCYKVQTYTSEALQLQPDINRAQPIWYYKLNEMIYQAYFHNSLIPILTLATLKNSAEIRFEYIPEIEIRQDEDSPKPDLEIDICCVVDGQIIIGECKKGNDLKDNGKSEEMVIQKYLRLAEQIQAHKVVFSTLENWSEPTLKLLEKYQNKMKNIEILIFQKQQLTQEY